MIDLYAMGSPNVVKIYIALEEMELPYTVHPVDVFGEAQFDPEFLRLNPLAKVPVITDHDGPGGKPYTLFESGAILQYLAEKTGQFLPKDPIGRFDALQWMMVQMTLVGPMFGQFVHFMRFAPKGNDYALDRYRTQARRALEALDTRLGVAPFLGGGELLDRRYRDVPLGAQCRLLARQAGGSRLPEADGLGRNHRRTAGGGAGVGKGRRGAGQDNPIRQGRCRGDGSPVRPRQARRGGVTSRGPGRDE